MNQFYVISMLSSTGRRSISKEQLESRNISFTFLDAVDGRQGTHELLKRFNSKKFLSRHGRHGLPGEAGCYASHYLAWQKCVELQTPVIIIEDDFNLSDDCLDAFTMAFELSKTFDFIRLEKTRKQPSLRVLKEGKFELRRYIKVPQCTTGYLITPTAAAAFIKASSEFVLPVDVFIRHVHLHGVPIHILTPSPVLRPDNSNEVSLIGNRHEQKAPLWCKLTRHFYKVKFLLMNSYTNILFFFNAKRKH